MTPVAAKPGRPFFSLKWKAVLLLSLILATVNLTLVSLNMVRLRDQLDHQREVLSQNQLREFKALLDQSFSNLERIAPLLVDSHDKGDSSLPLQDRFARQVQARAASLEFDWDITTLLFMDDSGRIGYRQGLDSVPVTLTKLLQDARQMEETQRMLLCQQGCTQYAAVPVLDEGGLAGVLLLGSTAADAVASFRRISGADLVILTSSDTGSDLPAWQRRLSLSSGGTPIRKLLQSLSGNIPFSHLRPRVPYRYRLGERTYDILRIPGVELPWNNRDDYLIISDITTEVQYIQAANRQSMLIGLAGFIGSELLLLFLLGTPMRRLERLAALLPQLAEGKTEQVKQALSRRSPGNFPDEIDIATAATTSLAGRLEELDREVQERTRSLMERSEALARERDFVSGLLRSAQVAILTLDAEGRIHSINPEGRRITGRGDEAIGKTSFLELLDESSHSPQLQQALKEVASGWHLSHQHESLVLSPDGTLRTVAWIHSRLATSSPEQPATILSVGLDTTKRKEAETRLAWLADHDPLTGLINRRRFQEDFADILARALRYGHQGALLFFDLDQFKYINDTSGHQAGDIMLKMVSSTLRNIVRETDLLARLGGDEFALVMPQTDADGARHMATRVLASLQRIELPVHTRVHRISASIGIVRFPEHGREVQDLMAHADLAMYQAKEIGRGRWHLFSWSEQKRKQFNDEVLWKQRIEQALEEDRFFLQFQPILEIASGTVTHYEVLIRMRETDGLVAMPGKFIPVAERTGLIHRIDQLVLARAVELLRRTPTQGFGLSINLSGKVIDEQAFLPLLRRLLRDSAIDPGRLLIEITETAALADMPSAAELMQEVRALGCRTALDDFGSGFSSFFYLRELSLDMVKIDGAFIRNLPRNSDDRLFVQAIIDVARGLGKQTIAEFVEDEETLRILRELGVDYAQGYYIGRPGELPVADETGDVINNASS